MTDIDKNASSEMSRDEAWDLIPWYVTGTLNPGEERAVAQYAESDPDFREEVSAQQRMQKLIGAQTPVPDPEEAWARMAGQIPHEDLAQVETHRERSKAPRSAGRPNLFAMLGCRLRGWPSLALGGALAASLVLALVLVSPASSPQGDFETLTDEVPAAESDLVELRLRAVPGAAESALRTALDAAGATDVDIAATGVIRAYVTPDMRAEALSRLRADPLFLVVAADDIAP